MGATVLALTLFTAAQPGGRAENAVEIDIQELNLKGLLPTFARPKLDPPKIPVKEEFERQLAALGSGDVGQRQAAAEYLYEHRCEAAVPQLLAALYDSDNHVRGCAAAALGQIGDRSAILPLILAFDYQERMSQISSYSSVSDSTNVMYWALQDLLGAQYGADLPALRRYRDNVLP